MNIIKLALLFAIVTGLTPTVSAQSPAELPALMKQFQSEVAAGETDKAVDSIEKIITLGEQMMGKNNPDIIRLYGQKAVLLRNLSRYDEAEKEVGNMRRKAKRAAGENSSLYGVSLNIAGSIKRMKNEFAAAEKDYNEAIKVLEKAGAAGEKDLAEAYANMNDLLSETNQLADAKRYGEKAYQLTKKLFGDESDRTIAALNNYGMTLKRLGELELAEQRLAESLALHRRVFGIDHRETAIAEMNMGLLYAVRGKYGKAEQNYKAAMKIVKAKLPPENQLHFSVGNNYGQLLLEEGKHEEAEPLLEAALTFGNEKLGDDHPLTGLAKHNLGCLMIETKRFDEAKRLLTSSAKTVAREPRKTSSANDRQQSLSGDVGRDRK